MGYVLKEDVIEAVKKHKRVGAHNDIYQLAHYHIIELIEKIPEVELRIVTADNESFLKNYDITRDRILGSGKE